MNVSDITNISDIMCPILHNYVIYVSDKHKYVRYNMNMSDITDMSDTT